MMHSQDHEAKAECQVTGRKVGQSAETGIECVSFDLWKLHKEVLPGDQQIHSMCLGEVSHYKDFR